MLQKCTADTRETAAAGWSRRLLITESMWIAGIVRKNRLGNWLIAGRTVEVAWVFTVAWHQHWRKNYNHNNNSTQNEQLNTNCSLIADGQSADIK